MQALANYSELNDSKSIKDLTGGSVSDTNTVGNMLVKGLNGIEAIPYQFMDTVDRRIPGTQIGRKYAEKIVTRLPLLFLTPCKPLFMDDFNSNDKSTVASFLANSEGASADLILGEGRYYSVEFDYAKYYDYLNPMLASVASYMGLYNETIYDGKKLGTYNWKKELNDDFKNFFSASENVVFYLDGLTQISESFSNSTTESSLASQINGFADTANEIKFLFGDKSGVAGALMEGASEVTSSIGSALSGLVGSLGGGIVESLSDKGVNTVLNGGKIIFPKIWENSDASISYNISIKLRSPDNDNLSIFLNIIKPYCRLLALTLPRTMENNPNGYRSPFLVKAYSKGLFHIDMGMITSMTVTKGDECAWNDNGLPTQIDIDLTIEDLYSSLSMSGINGKSMVTNTAYMDFLANLAGLNVNQQGMGKRIKKYVELTYTNVANLPSRTFTRFSNSISNIIGNMYNVL